MNWLGKLFVVAIFAMSILFMGFAITVYSSHRNWRDMVTNTTPAPGKPLGLQRQLSEQQTRNSQLQAQLDAVEKEIAAEAGAHQATLAQLQTELMLKQEYDKQVTEHAALVEGQAVAATEAAHKTLKPSAASDQTPRRHPESCKREGTGV
jgi:hypothetical protein